MNKVDWADIPVCVNWVTGDASGLFYWVHEPKWDNDSGEFIGAGPFMAADDYEGSPFIEGRPTVGDKP